MELLGKWISLAVASFGMRGSGFAGTNGLVDFSYPWLAVEEVT